jgi:thioredoxin reductase
MSQYLVHQINETSSIKVWLNALVTEVNGENKLENITIKNTKTGKQQCSTYRIIYIYILLQSPTQTGSIEYYKEIIMVLFLLDRIYLIVDIHKIG